MAALTGSVLVQSIAQPALTRGAVEPQVVGPGQWAVVYFWLPLGSRVPRHVTHHLDLVVRGDSPRAVAPVRTEPVTVVATPEVLDPPVAGGPWVAIYAPSLIGGHRTTVLALGGKARIPARFAIDWIRVPECRNGGPALPNCEPIRNGFGTDVLAVADGRIGTVRDGAPDLTAGLLRRPERLSLDEGSGNYVVLDLGQGRFAVYEHLQQGSLHVTPGQQVKRGEVIARLGSSGSTSIGPHLHFHLADANATLAAEGCPTCSGASNSSALTRRWRPF